MKLSGLFRKAAPARRDDQAEVTRLSDELRQLQRRMVDAASWYERRLVATRRLNLVGGACTATLVIMAVAHFLFG